MFDKHCLLCCYVHACIGVDVQECERCMQFCLPLHCVLKVLLRLSCELPGPLLTSLQV
jgi:hypothetical protein